MARNMYRLGVGKSSFKSTKIEKDWTNIEFIFAVPGKDITGVEYGNVNTPPPVSVISSLSGPGYFAARVDPGREGSSFYSSWFGRYSERRWLFDINFYIGLSLEEEDHEPWLVKGVSIDTKMDLLTRSKTILKVFNTSFSQEDANTRITGPWNFNRCFLANSLVRDNAVYFRLYVRLNGKTSQQTKDVYVLDRGSYFAVEALPLVTPDEET